MKINKTTLIAGFTAAYLLAAGGNALAQDTTPDNGTAATAISDPVAVYRYGRNIDQSALEYVAIMMSQRGIPTQAVSGYGLDDCVLLVIRGQEIGLYGADDIRRTIGSATIRAVADKPLRRAQLGDCGRTFSELIAIYRYGANIDSDSVEYAADILTSVGVPTQAIAGYEIDDCVLLIVRGEEIGLYGASDLETKIGLAARRAANDKVLRNSHMGDCGETLSPPVD